MTYKTALAFNSWRYDPSLIRLNVSATNSSAPSSVVAGKRGNPPNAGISNSCIITQPNNNHEPIIGGANKANTIIAMTNNGNRVYPISKRPRRLTNPERVIRLTIAHLFCESLKPRLEKRRLLGFVTFYKETDWTASPRINAGCAVLQHAFLFCLWRVDADELSMTVGPQQNWLLLMPSFEASEAEIKFPKPYNL